MRIEGSLATVPKVHGGEASTVPKTTRQSRRDALEEKTNQADHDVSQSYGWRISTCEMCSSRRDLAICALGVGAMPANMLKSTLNRSELRPPGVPFY